MRYGVRAILVAAVLTGGVGTVHAAGGGGGAGGGNACPWWQDVTLDLGGRQLVVPQTAFDPKTMQLTIDGYEVVPVTGQLLLRVFGPDGHIWEAGLTRIAGGKKCIVFYAGPALLVASPAGHDDEDAPHTPPARRPAGGGH